MTIGAMQEEKAGTWLDRVLGKGIQVRAEAAILAVLILLAVVSRFYNVGYRVMSHDETTHVYYSWNLYQGRGFQHNPLMHGPLQFHLWALSYFLFGDNDTAGRIPTAAMGVAAVAMVWLFRRWLGRTGALVATGLMLISPFMLFYSRYTREDPFVIPEALLMFWAIFRYMEDRKPKWLYVLSVALVLHYMTKETAFIYAAQLLLFLGAYLVGDWLREPWNRPGMRIAFLVGLAATVVGLGVGGYVFMRDRAAFNALLPSSTATAGEGGATTLVPPPISPVVTIGALLAVLGAVLMVAALILNFGRRLRTDFPALDVFVIALTVTLPQLTAIPAKLLGWDPIAYQDANAINRDTVVVIILFALAVIIGLLWDWKRWLIASSLFWGLFITFYTTLFTYGFGFFTGLVGSLGYWLAQQPVQRGGQPWFYYPLIQIPVYEYLPAIGVLAAAVIGVISLRRSRQPRSEGEESQAASIETQNQPASSSFPALFFLGYWAVTAVIAYSYAGEKMPWLTVHIALPMILLSGWVFGKFLDSIDWSRLRASRAWLELAAVVLLLISGVSALGYLLGVIPPFQGTTLEQLGSTTGFLASLVVAVGSAIYVALQWKAWRPRELVQLLGVAALGLLGVLTARTAFRAAFVNYDLATEYLVYAHSAPGVRLIMNQIDDLSTRTADGQGLDVGYDDETSYPFMWYLRNYPRVHFFGGSPSRELLNYPVIIAGGGNWAKIEPILGKRYLSFEYTRLWWPNQDYWRMGWSSIEAEHNADLSNAGQPLTPLTPGEYVVRVWRHLVPFFTDPAVRHAVWEIWLNRDFTEWGRLNNTDMSIGNWSPGERMKMYVRKDIAALLWDYGVTAAGLGPGAAEDPYAKGMVTLAAQTVFGVKGSEPGQFNAPRNVAVASDGTLYVADTSNHRIQHLRPDGTVIQVWGSFADASKGEAPGGTFNEPWGIAVAPDGTVYVADTWNHRVQHFTSDGRFLNMFGTFGQAESPTAFWGPRAVMVDKAGRLFVADTGNKRIVLFDSQGNALGQFGQVGTEPGQLDEPVGLAIDSTGLLYVADTWNQRIQVFAETERDKFAYLREIAVDAWYGQSLDNKPYLAIVGGDRICASDPEGFRVLCFNADGTFAKGWGKSGSGPEGFGLVGGLAAGPDDTLWVTDPGNSRLMQFAPGLP